MDTTHSALLTAWNEVLPGHPDIGQDLLARWQEPHRHYHGPDHLAHGLDALDQLGASPLEVIAWWYHDAVHHMDTPRDEQRSAALAREQLTGVLDPDQVEEVARLVLVTIDHRPGRDDGPGQRISDADLAMLALPAADYQHTVEGLRAEVPQMADPAWEAGRIRFLGDLLNRGALFSTEWGREHWQEPAVANISDERDRLLGVQA